MITLNGKKFAKNDKEFTASLFDSNGTCVGYYKRYARQIKLYNMQRVLIGVVNKYGVLCHAQVIDGKAWYSHCSIKEIEANKEYPLIKQRSDIDKIAIRKEYRNELEYWFK